MNKILVSGLLLTVAFGADASKLDPGSRARLRAATAPVSLRQSVETPGAVMLKKTSAETGDPRVGAFITLAPGFSVSDLEAEGVDVVNARGGIVLARLSASEIAILEESEAVKSITVEKSVDTKMNLARELTGIDRIHAGDGLPQPYTGKGVLAGIVDGGFDPNHLNFMNPDGTTRIKSFTYFRPMQQGGYNTETYGSDYIHNIDTESSETFHGTHTLGIMAGGYRGDVTVGKATTDPTVPGGIRPGTEVIANPYYGVATGADIAIASGAGTDYLMALGMEEILNYAYDHARETGKRYPVVINLSLGTNIGPHDGTSTISRYMDAVTASDEVPAVICVSAGNEGDLPIALNKRLTAEDNSVKTCFKSLDVAPDTYPNAVVEQVYIYSDSETPFELQAVIINRSRGREALRIAIEGTPEGVEKYYVSSSDYMSADTDFVSEQLAKNFTGYIGVAGMLDTTESGRYMGVVDMMLWNTPDNNDDYVVGLIATGTDGQRIDLYTTGNFFTLDDLGLSDRGYQSGTTDGTISDVATGHNVVVVGSYNTRDRWTSVDGYIYGYGDMFSNHRVSDFSSYGTLLDGRELPTVCAPGATVISSTNEYYLEKYNLGDDNRQAVAEANGRKYSWHQCVGTSMSAPLVSGTVATWLEANPYLTYQDVIEIIRSTALVDEDVRAGNPVQWGAGKFDAYSGLKAALDKAGISAPLSGASDGPSVMLRPVDGGYEVFLAGASALDVCLTDIAGCCVAHVAATGNETIITTDGICKGIYILTVNGCHSRKIVVR